VSTSRLTADPIPNDFSQTLTIAKYELLNYRRSRRFLILLGLFLGGGLAATFVFGYDLPLHSTPISFVSHWVKYSMLPVIALPASLLGGDAISSEFQIKTGYSMIGNPMKRSSLWFGKVIAAFSMSTLMLCILQIIAVTNLAYYFGFTGIPLLFWDSFFFTIVAIAGALGIAFFLSSVLKNGPIATLFSVFLLLIGFDLIVTVILLTGSEPWFMFDYGELIIKNILVTPYPAHIISQGLGITPAPGIPHIITTVTYTATVVEGLVIMAGYFLAGMAGSLIIFSRREFTG